MFKIFHVHLFIISFYSTHHKNRPTLQALQLLGRPSRPGSDFWPIAQYLESFRHNRNVEIKF